MIAIKLPPLLAALFQLFLEKAHSVTSPGLLHIFSNKSGAAMDKAAQLTAYWESLLKRLGSPAVLPPHRYAALPCSCSHTLGTLGYFGYLGLRHV